MLIQLVLLATIYAFDLRNKNAVKHLFTRKIFLAEIISFVVLTALSFIVTPIGDFLGLESGFVTLTPFYFLLTIVPAIAFVVCYTIMLASEKDKPTRKGSNSARKSVKNEK